MNPVVIGTPDEVLGFALAGATTFVATTDAEVEKAIVRAKKTDEPLIIVVRDGDLRFVFPE
jgi:vacuolar-type H+-ATPase subunit F/Vma7